MIHKILCSTDLASASTTGVSYAFSLARRNTAQLIIVHAISFPRVWHCPCELDAYYDWEQIAAKLKVERLLMAGERRVKQFICKHLSRESSGVPWRPKIVLLGRLAQEIVTAAIQEEADLIVMDRRRRSWLARAFTEDTLERVSRFAPCPVLSIDASKSNISSEAWPLPILTQLPSY